MNVTFITAWNHVREKDEYVPPHTHDYYELVYYPTNRGVTLIDDERFDFSPQSYAIMPAEISHEENHYVTGLLYCIGFRTDMPLPTGVFEDSNGEIFHLVREIMSESYEQKHAYKEMLIAKIMELSVQLIRKEYKFSGRTEPLNFEYVLNFLTNNFSEKIVFSDLAGQLNLSYDYFQHRFRELYGVSPQQFLLQKRLSVAQELLNNSELNCTDIAYRCGFSNSSQFSMIFRRELGVTPSQFRKRKSIVNK